MMNKLPALWRKMTLSALCGAMLLASGQVGAAAYAYKISVAATIPKGFAGEKPLSTQPSNTKFTPCSAAKLDGVTFTVTYDAGKLLSDMKDVYLILYNPDVNSTVGINQGPFFTVRKYPLGNNQVLTPYLTVTDLNDTTGTTAAKNDIYVKASENPGSGAISEPVFGGSIILEGVTSGTWQMVGIIADHLTINFNDPTTWAAWDVATIILGKPWAANDILPVAPAVTAAGCNSIMP
jgi:hypothetical protein